MGLLVSSKRELPNLVLRFGCTLSSRTQPRAFRGWREGSAVRFFAVRFLALQPFALFGLLCFIRRRRGIAMARTYWVYILASRSRNLYTGVTNNALRRMTEHREGLVPGFTSQYRIFRLVHLEAFSDIRDAIAREKEIKAWRREKKIRLIEHENRTWDDVATRFLDNQGDARKETADPSRHPQKTRLGSG
jgi:putative endonuclease